MVVFRADEKRDCRLVEAAPLPVPLLYGIECAFPREVEHEEDSDGVIANQREHVDKLALATKIPYREGDFRVANRNGLFHEIHTCRKLARSASGEEWHVPSV